MTSASSSTDAVLERCKGALSSARRCLDSGDPAGALEALRAVANAAAPTSVQLQLSRLAGRIAAGLPNLAEVRIAFCADCTVADLLASLVWHLLLEGWRLNAHVVPLGTWRQQVRDAGSPLYQFHPELVWIFVDSSFVQGDRGAVRSAPGASAEVRTLCEELSTYAKVMQARCGAQVLLNNIVPPAWRVLGNFESSLPGGVAHTVHLFNSALPGYLSGGAAVFDLAYLASCFGLARWEDRRLWLHSRHPFSLDAHAGVALAMARLVVAAKGRSRKCIVIDLDNTLWGGVVGDDGIDGLVLGLDGGANGEAFASFQSWLKAHVDRGVLLAVCSKNDEAVARGPFERHPAMVLTLDDLAAFKVNWCNKADNIRKLAAELNIGLDSMVFVDDNPAERALVHRELPEVAIAELSEDPAEYISCLAAGRWFETLAVTPEDLHRSQGYRDNAARHAASVGVSDLPTYLQGLEMQANWGQVDGSSLGRFTQLINKTNQFHLTTTRYSQAEVLALQASGHHWLGHFALMDRFGDNGIISAVILHFEQEIAWIDTWAMSCRVFSRTMEDFIICRLATTARQHGCSSLRGRYRPTSKNAIVANLYANFGATLVAGGADREEIWYFDLPNLALKDSPYITDSRPLGVHKLTPGEKT